MRFKTVKHCKKKCRGWKYNFTFWKSALSKKLGGKYALDLKIIWSSADILHKFWQIIILYDFTENLFNATFMIDKIVT